MYHFIQERADKNCRWRMIPADTNLIINPAFKTVLAVSSDPAQILEQGSDPDDKVRYFGPMYFDLDGSDIAEVIEDAKFLVHQLREIHRVPSNALRIYLSGKKGFHVLISEKTFGLPEKGKLYLPLIYKEFSNKFNLNSLDEVVYSLGKGRMWRCTGIQRPDNGKYKVQITEAELAGLTEESYSQLCSSPRPDFAIQGEIEEIPELKSFVETTFELVKRKVKEQQREHGNFTVQDIQNIEGVPGCIELLVTQGDCPDSNWNIAAMTLASYIAAKYEDQEEGEDLINRFITNVDSGSRPTEAMRRAAMTDLLGRAYTGSLKFYVGTLIKTLGKPCGSCPICTKELESTAQGKRTGYDSKSNVQIAERDVYIVGEKSNKRIANFNLQPVKVFCHLDKFGQQVIEECDYRIYADDLSSKGELISLKEEELIDRRKLNGALMGRGVFEGTESELLAYNIALLKLKRESDFVIRTPISGILFFEREGEVYPQLIMRNESYSKGGGLSPFEYVGNKRFAPDYSIVREFDEEAIKDLEVGINALFGMNEDNVIIPAVGWVMACHLKTHLTHRDKGFPMLSISGTSHTGKSSTAMILMTLNAFPYRRAPVWNSETDTIYPLEDMVTSTRTIIRIIEEANEHVAKRNWPKLLGILKSSWDESGISKGTIKGRQVITETKENTAPIMFLSEQAFPVQSIRTRCVEVSFQTKTVDDPEKSENHDIVVDNVYTFEMFAKKAALAALDLSDEEVNERRKKQRDLVPPEYRGRSQTSATVVLLGLEFMAEVMQELSPKTAELILEKKETYLDILYKTAHKSNERSARSALDELIMMLDQMAGEWDNTSHGLVAGTHYWREGAKIYLDLRSIMPRYLRYIRGLGDTPSVRTVVQLERLIEGEVYYIGVTPHPEYPALGLVTLEEEILTLKGLNLNNFKEKGL
jgi:hypothetical protein